MVSETALFIVVDTTNSPLVFAGTYIFFGIFTFIGAGFIWYVVPETSRLTLEEMDLIFGSAGVAAADAERMTAINKEIGLDSLLRGRHADSGSDGDEKKLSAGEGPERVGTADEIHEVEKA